MAGGEDSEDGNEDGAGDQNGSGESSGGDNEAGGGLGGLLDGIADAFGDVAGAARQTESPEDLADRLFESHLFFERAHFEGKEKIPNVGSSGEVECAVLIVDQSDFDAGEVSSVLGDGYENFGLAYMRSWSPFTEGDSLLA